MEFKSTPPVFLAVVFVALMMGAFPQLAGADDGKQGDRKTFIAKLKVLGVISKIEKLADYPHVTVGPKFKSLSYEDKNAFMNVVFAYYYNQNQSNDLVLIYDYHTGKKIGSYSMRGLELE